MDYIFPDQLLRGDSSYSWPPSSILYWRSDAEQYCSSAAISRLVSTLMLNVSNEAADRNLRAVYIRPEPLDKTHFVHVHGTRPLDTANWDNIHFLHLKTEQSLIHWLSHVHLGKRFADLIILDGLEMYVKLQNLSDCTNVLRLTSLLEETRVFVHGATRADEHGHDCRLLVTCKLPKSPAGIHNFTSPFIPSHGLLGTYILINQGSSSCFQLHAVEHSWKLELESKHDELFWTTIIPVPDTSMRGP